MANGEYPILKLVSSGLDILNSTFIIHFLISLAQLNRSAGENFHGAKLVSMF